MLAALKKLFEECAKGASAAEKTQHAEKLAALVLLIQTGRADHHLDDIELEKVVELAREHFNLGDQCHNELVDIAMKEAEDSTSLYEYTSLINEAFTPQQKFKLIFDMWQVAFADGHIDRYEEHLIRKIADLIYVPHTQFIEAKHLAGSASS